MKYVCWYCPPPCSHTLNDHMICRAAFEAFASNATYSSVLPKDVMTPDVAEWMPGFIDGRLSSGIVGINVTAVMAGLPVQLSPAAARARWLPVLQVAPVTEDSVVTLLIDSADPVRRP